MSCRSNKMSAPLIINHREYIYFVESSISSKTLSNNTPAAENDQYRIIRELKEIINLDCLIDISLLKYNQIKLNSIANMLLNSAFHKDYFFSSNEKNVINCLSYA